MAGEIFLVLFGLLLVFSGLLLVTNELHGIRGILQDVVDGRYEAEPVEEELPYIKLGPEHIISHENKGE